MKKSDKIKIVDELIEKAVRLIYDTTTNPEISVVHEALSFVRNTVDEKNVVQWTNAIEHISWGVHRANSAEAEGIRVTRWHSGRDKFIDTLKSLKQEIERFTPDDIDNITSANCTINSDPIIFLSHSSIDKSYGDALEKVISGLGVKEKQLIYTSHPLHKIPLDKNIYDYLRENFSKNIFVIFLWSDNYLDSPACLIELGAAWVTQSDYSNIFIPDFNFDNPKFHVCAVDDKKIGIRLKGDDHCKISMIELKDKIISLFGLSVDEKKISLLLDDFIKEINSI